MKAIPGSPPYVAGEDGHIYGQRGKRLKAAVHNNGYLRVAIYVSKRRRNRYVHQLVAEAFHGPKPDGAVCRHLDSDRMNNRPANVVYGTAKENIHDQIALGTRPRGEMIVWSVLTDAIVLEIRRRVARGEKQNAIAKEIGATTDAVNKAVHGKTFRHLPGALLNIRKYPRRTIK